MREWRGPCTNDMDNDVEKGGRREKTRQRRVDNRQQRRKRLDNGIVDQ